MPYIQLAFNFLPLAIGFFVKYLFFIKIGWGKEYKEGLLEGFHNMKEQKKIIIHGYVLILIKNNQKIRYTFIGV